MVDNTGGDRFRHDRIGSMQLCDGFHLLRRRHCLYSLWRSCAPGLPFAVPLIPPVALDVAAPLAASVFVQIDQRAVSSHMFVGTHQVHVSPSTPAQSQIFIKK